VNVASNRDGDIGFRATIFRARYGGIYEGGRWIAYPSHPWEVPDQVHGSDIESSEWFHEHSDEVGVGDTPNEALADLRGRIERKRRARQGGAPEWE
jgi:hypothetical protein